MDTSFNNNYLSPKNVGFSDHSFKTNSTSHLFPKLPLHSNHYKYDFSSTTTTTNNDYHNNHNNNISDYSLNLNNLSNTKTNKNMGNLPQIFNANTKTTGGTKPRGIDDVLSVFQEINDNESSYYDQQSTILHTKNKKYQTSYSKPKIRKEYHHINDIIDYDGMACIDNDEYDEMSCVDDHIYHHNKYTKHKQTNPFTKYT